MNTPKLTQDIIKTFFGFHQRRGYKHFDSFPLVTEDPTVMFMNATITPFKTWFTNPGEQPQNFVLAQRCFRLGDTSGLSLIETCPYYFTFFQMLGSGTFCVSHIQAVHNLLELLDDLGLEKKRLVFTIPDDPRFKEALTENGVSEENVFSITENDVFWQAWKFGKFGPVGKGLTVIYSRTSLEEKKSVEVMAKNPDKYVELLNLIYIFGQDAGDNKVIPIPHHGFDLGMGLERIATAIQGGNSYEIDSVQPLVQVVSRFIGQVPSADLGLSRILTDHLRSICILADAGVKPSNKRHGYALRRITRHSLELLWARAGRTVALNEVMENFVSKLADCGIPVSVPLHALCNIINQESQGLIQILKDARRILEKQPTILPSVLKDTYGIPLTLQPLVKGAQK